MASQRRLKRKGNELKALTVNRWLGCGSPEVATELGSVTCRVDELDATSRRVADLFNVCGLGQSPCTGGPRRNTNTRTLIVPCPIVLKLLTWNSPIFLT